MSGFVNKRVRARYANGLGIHGEGRVVSYCEVPSYTIECVDGTRFSWRADLVDLIDPDDCGACWECDPEFRFMRICPTCGNKRCPHANDHRNECTGSNEPGQPGSAYPTTQFLSGQALIDHIEDFQRRLREETK